MDFINYPGFEILYTAMLDFNQGNHAPLLEYFHDLMDKNSTVKGIFNKFQEAKENEKEKIFTFLNFFAEEKTKKYNLLNKLPLNATLLDYKVSEIKSGFFANLPNEILCNIAKYTADSTILSSDEAEKVAYSNPSSEFQL